MQSFNQQTSFSSYVFLQFLSREREAELGILSGRRAPRTERVFKVLIIGSTDNQIFSPVPLDATVTMYPANSSPKDVGSDRRRSRGGARHNPGEFGV